MELYNPTLSNIYNEQLAQKQNHHEKHDKMTKIPLIGAL